MNTRKTLITALFTGLIIVGTFIRIPLPPVPITLQTMFVILAALLGGLSIGFYSFIIYLVLGTIGLPIFTSGGGIGALIGPTGGYIFGMLLATIVAGFISDLGKNKEKKLPYFIIAALLATVVIYLVGIPWLKYATSINWSKAFALGLTPFIVGDVIKLLVSIFLATKFYDRIHQLINKEEETE